MNTKLITAGLAAILAATAVGAPTQSKITKITSKNVGAGVEIAIHGESLKAPRTFFISGGTSYVVEFRAKLATKPARFKVRRSGVDYFNYAQYRVSPQIARLHVKLDKGVKPILSNKDGTWFVRINVTAQKKRPLTPAQLDRIAMEKAIAAIGTPNKPAVPPTKSAAKAVSKPAANAAGTTTKQTIKQFEAPALKEGTIVGISRKTIYERNGLVTTSIKPTPNVPAEPSTGLSGVMVSVVVERADVLQILEAFARQSGVNIISSPDVSPRDEPLLLTMTMRNVELDFAMTAVTAVAGLRYTRVGNTYVVSPTAVFPTIAKKIRDLYNENVETRVVSIVSGEAAQIREATLKAVPQDGSGGYYAIIDPTE
ncbi:MAG: AMIN domain-containing protein, partial [Armatimonadetes bacterium]|nr:AMIN domain-containing protein [Armatimonadota bacterium]